MIQLALGSTQSRSGWRRSSSPPACRSGARLRFRGRGASAGAGRRFPGARRVRGPGHPRRSHGDRFDARPAHPPVHRCRHELRDRARIVVRGGCDGCARRAPRSRVHDPLRHACRRRGDRGRRITDDDVEIQVIGDIEPTGICGSGLVDIVAELLRVGLLEPSGRLAGEEEAAVLTPGLADRLARVPNGKGGEERVFVLARRGDDPARAVYLSQVDVRAAAGGESRDRDRVEDARPPSSGSRRPTSSRCFSAARSART